MKSNPLATELEAFAKIAPDLKRRMLNDALARVKEAPRLRFNFAAALGAVVELRIDVERLRAERDEAQRIAAQLRTETGERIYRLEKALVTTLKKRDEARDCIGFNAYRALESERDRISELHAASQAEIDRLRARVEHATTPECVGTIVAGEGYVPACRTLRAERDEAAALLRKCREWIETEEADYAEHLRQSIDAALKGDVK